jgi:hypothetical protein
MQALNYIDYNNIASLMQMLEQQILIITKLNKMPTTYLLDTNKNNMSLIEKFVYDTAKFQLNRIDKTINSDLHIEFWVKSEIVYDCVHKTHTGLYDFHIDKDEKLYKENGTYKTPIFSNVTYFNDSQFPLLLTDIVPDVFNFKEFNQNNNIELIFPVKGKSITFDGRFYHAVVDPFNKCNEDNVINHRAIIAINVWDNDICDTPIYVNLNTNDECYDKEQRIFHFKPNSYGQDTHTINTEQILSYDFFNDLLYGKILTLPANILQSINADVSKNITNFKLINERNSDSNNDFQMSILENELEHLRHCIETNSQISIETRFRQRFTYNNIFSPDTCKWIIHEAENYATNNGGWLTTRHINYPTVDLEIENIKPIFTYILFQINNILDKIKKSYCIDKYNLNIHDLFIVKYDAKDGQPGLEKHLDGCYLSINISLSDINAYDGGGVQFYDGITYNGNIGDVLVHSGQIYHAGINITSGVRYIMVAFINLSQ